MAERASEKRRYAPQDVVGDDYRGAPPGLSVVSTCWRKLSCFGDDPSGRSKRSDDDSHEGRWRSFTLDKIKGHHYKLDAFKWLRDEELDDPDELPEPEELITEAMEELRLALDDLGDIQRLLEGNGAGS